MAEILPFTKESIIKAAEIIDQNPNLRKGRESIEYDFVLDSKRYPPILVLSEANKSLGGSELLLTDFGNSTKKPFKILRDFGFKIEKKYTILSKEIISEIIDLCDKMATGRTNGTITKENYSDIFRPFLDSFEKKFTYSPNVILQNQLQNFYNLNLKDVSSKLKFKNYSFWGRSIYNYTWSCIFYDFDKQSMQASYSPQLYILVNKDGIKFGFCYGHQVNPNDYLVTSALQGHAFTLLKKTLQNDKNLSFFNSTEEEITARPEKLFGREERILVTSDDSIRDNWSNTSLLIKEFPKDNIPENISEIIQYTLTNLKDFFLALLPTTNQNRLNTPRTINAKIQFSVASLYETIKSSGLYVSKDLLVRLSASLLTKPFVILTGLSGSGKTKLAQAFAMWICENFNQYCIVAVGADWTNRDPLLGFPNALETRIYTKPDNGILDLIIEASKAENRLKPFFIILDEMNLSHVERYFADFLSVMESKAEQGIFLHSDKIRKDTNDKIIPNNIKLPNNVFVIGTVNIDETTYMFSPKVLDRANVIEFRVTKEEMRYYLDSKTIVKFDNLTGAGKEAAESFTSIAFDEDLELEDPNDINSVLLDFFSELTKNGAEFGYRSASEILRFAAIVNRIEPNWEVDDILDAAIMQKLLPRVHGSRKRLASILETLGSLCMIAKPNAEERMEHFLNPQEEKDFSSRIRYPMSFEKISRMYRALLHNGFTSYAEA